MQGVGGIMSITGEPEGAPIKVAVAISDIVAGLFAARPCWRHWWNAPYRRRPPLRGALLDAQVAWLANRAGDWLISGIEPNRLERPSVDRALRDVPRQ